MMKKIGAVAVCMAVLGLWMLVPTASGATFYSKEAITQMNGEINNASIDNFVDPFPEDHQKLLKQDWIKFGQEVDSAVKFGNGEVDNTYICTSIWLHVWSWKALYWNLRGAALCP